MNTLPNFARECINLAAAFRRTERLNMHEGVANHFSLVAQAIPTDPIELRYCVPAINPFSTLPNGAGAEEKRANT